MLAIDILSPCFEFIKKRFFPINKSYWLKLGFVSLISTRSGVNTQIGRGINSFSKFGNFIKKYWVFLLGISGIGLVLGFLWNIVQNTFLFIFLDSILKGKVKIKKGFGKHVKKGVSLFYFQLLIGLAFLLLISIIALPAIIVYFSGNTPSGIATVLYIIVAVLVFFLMLMTVICINLLVYYLVIYEMYISNLKFKPALRNTIDLCKKEYKEVLMFILFKVLISIGAGVTIILILIPVLIIFMIIAGIFAVPLILVGNLVIGLIIGLPIAIILFLVFIYTMAVVNVPVTGYLQYYSYRFMKEVKKL